MFPEYLQWFHYCEGMVLPPINTIVVQTILLPSERRVVTELRQAKRLLTRALAPIEEALSGRDCLIGDPSAAVYSWYGQLVLTALYESKEFLQVDSYTNLARWATEIHERPAVHRGRKVIVRVRVVWPGVTMPAI